MSSSRVANTKRNVIWSYLEYLITIIFSFVSRSVIVYFLGADYLGVSSLFSSILQVLNVAELGFSIAVTYNMYKPLAENDTATVCALLSFYRKIYNIIGIVILVAGLIVTPFIPYLIKDEYPASLNIYILFILYLFNTAISYFLFSYKAALLNALQRMDLTKVARCLVNILVSALQILAIALFKNYYLFIIVSIIGTAANNLFTAYIATKKYPQYICEGILSKEVKDSIAQRVKGLLICNISAITYTTFDSIILSALRGLVTVAVYNNYLVVFNGLTNVIVLVRLAMQASVGNSVASESVEKNYKDLLKWQFLFSMIAMFCSACLVCLYQPFMKLWMGEDMMLPLVDVILLSVLFFIDVVQHAYCLYLNAAGLWLEMKWAYIGSAILNIVMNLVLCHYFAVTGIIMATLISSFISGFIWQLLVIFKSYFKRKATGYLVKQFLYFALAAAVAGLSYFLTSLVPFEGIIGLIVRGVICLCISFLVIVLLFRKTEQYKACLDIAKAMLKRK